MKQHTKYSSKDFSLCTHESDENRGNFEVLQITAHNVLRYFKLFVIDIVFVHVVKDSCRVKYVMNNIIVSKISLLSFSVTDPEICWIQSRETIVKLSFESEDQYDLKIRS